MKLRSSIRIKASFWSSHRWKKAPAHRSYLRIKHAHRFHVMVEIPVMHNDRDVEFHDAADLLDQVIQQTKKARDAVEWSCETWGEQIIRRLGRKGIVASRCDVWEDDSHGATVEVADGH